MTNTLSNKAVDLEIIGGRKLSGNVSVKTSKNAAVGLLCASLLNRGTTTLLDMPKIEEVHRIIEALESIGVGVSWNGSNVVINPPEKISVENINIEVATKTRAALMLVGPLVHILKEFRLPYAGGCKLGRRSILPHQYALEKLGVKVSTDGGFYRISAKQLKSNYVVLYESGDTVTENILMAAACLDGKTTIKFASANYQVQDLCFFLEKLGIRVDGIGTTTLTVWGKSGEIRRNVEYHISEDPIEAMLFLSIAIVTNSEITIKRAPIEFLELELLTLEKMGFKYELSKRYKALNGETDLVDIKTKKSQLHAPEEKIHARPFPGLNIDNLPFFVPIAGAAKGETLIHDWVYEGRSVYYTELEKLGLDIKLADPHRVYIKGPTKWRSADIMCPPALRPAAIILIGMLAARGVSRLRNIYSIARGYENLAERLSELGAKVRVL